MMLYINYHRILSMGTHVTVTLVTLDRTVVLILMIVILILVCMEEPAL